jgi:hypothetical protein
MPLILTTSPRIVLPSRMHRGHWNLRAAAAQLSTLTLRVTMAALVLYSALEDAQIEPCHGSVGYELLKNFEHGTAALRLPWQFISERRRRRRGRRRAASHGYASSDTTTDARH